MELDTEVYAKYPKLTGGEIKKLVVEDKWFASINIAVHGEMNRVSQQLTKRVMELAERYKTPLPQITNRVKEQEGKVKDHLKKMGFAWK